jgi:ATP-dependent DNA helicase RecQ
MVSYAVSGFCRWKVLLDYFSDEAPGFDQCCKCDNCRNPPLLTLTEELPIRDDEFDRTSTIEVGPLFAIGAAVKVAKYDAGSVVGIAADQVTIAFPDGAQRTFMADFVTALNS